MMRKERQSGHRCPIWRKKRSDGRGPARLWGIVKSRRDRRSSGRPIDGCVAGAERGSHPSPPSVDPPSFGTSGRRACGRPHEKSAEDRDRHEVVVVPDPAPGGLPVDRRVDRDQPQERPDTQMRNKPLLARGSPLARRERARAGVIEPEPMALELLEHVFVCGHVDERRPVAELVGEEPTRSWRPRSSRCCAIQRIPWSYSIAQ